MGTEELARREPNITAFSLHPGVVSTDMTGSVSGLVLHAWCLWDGQSPCPRNAAEGATTQTYVAVAPKEELSQSNGKFFDSCKVRTSVRDKYAKLHGEDQTLTYQAAIYDLVHEFTGSRAAVMV